MSREKKQFGGILLIAVLAVVLVILNLHPAYALPEERRKVRVAYPIQQGLTDFDENGDYSGYTYDYLEEVAQYTGWDYEFVQVPGTVDESLQTLMDMLKRGEIDLMGAMLYVPEMGQEYDYSSHSYGTVETVLQVLNDNPEDVAINSQVMQTLRVAVVGRGRLVRELEDYCAMNMIMPGYVDCDSQAEQVRALREGRADVMLNLSLSYVEGVRTIARFSPKPFYFVTTKGDDSGLMEELNSAILSIEQTDPYFTTTLFEKYFMPAQGELRISSEEQAFIESAAPVQVGVLERQPPFQYVEDGTVKGISVDMLRRISEKTGLEFEYVTAPSLEELYAMAGEGRINLVAGMSYSYDVAREENLAMTRPYVSMPYVLMMNERISEKQLNGKRLALLKTSPYHGYFVGNVVRYDTIDACIRAVNRGEVDYTYVDTYTAQYYVNMPDYSDLKLAIQTYAPRTICFGLVKSENRELLDILNKTVLSFSMEEKQAIINQNIIRKPQFTLRHFVKKNPVVSMACLTVAFSLLLLLLLLFLMILYQKGDADRKTALELKKHLRLFAIADDYFFEYNFRTNCMLLSVPNESKENEVHLRQVDFKKISEAPEEQERKEMFFKLLHTGTDLVRELRLNCEDGREHWLRVIMETIRDDAGALAYAVGKIELIDEEKKEKDKLLQKAQLDSLTQLLNAETMRNRIAESLASLEEGETGALLMIDIDCFKAINDTYGHLQGDKTLIAVAGLFRTCFRSEDLAGRPGGDEFMIYMREAGDAGVLSDQCAFLCAKARELSGELGFSVTFSIGGVLSRRSDTYEHLYKLADAALYKAKQNGRDQFRIAERGAAAGPALCAPDSADKSD